MDVEQIRQLVELMKENELTEMRLRDGEATIILRRGCQKDQAVTVSGPATAPAAQTPPVAPSAAAPAEAGVSQPEQQALPTINSPMVGTFYAAADPESEPFVKVGDHVTSDTVVCIIEAMKVFNEIKAEMSGTIEKILIENEQPVEFGQPMFVVRPD